MVQKLPRVRGGSYAGLMCVSVLSRALLIFLDSDSINESTFFCIKERTLVQLCSKRTSSCLVYTEQQHITSNIEAYKKKLKKHYILSNRTMLKLIICMYTISGRIN